MSDLYTAGLIYSERRALPKREDKPRMTDIIEVELVSFGRVSRQRRYVTIIGMFDALGRIDYERSMLFPHGTEEHTAIRETILLFDEEYLRLVEKYKADNIEYIAAQEADDGDVPF